MALYLQKNTVDGARIAVWQLSETEEELIGVSDLNESALGDIMAFKSESLRRQKLAVRALLNYMFGTDVRLGHGGDDKPYLKKLDTKISVTHTPKYVAVIAHETMPVGIDMESLDRDFSAVQKKALTENELRDLREENRSAQLALYWCVKEAVFKKMGELAVEFSEKIEVEKFEVLDSGKIRANFLREGGKSVEIPLEYMTFDRHILVWTTS